MKCILHIGTEKTGSSSLQEFLYLNRKHLKEQGYLVPLSAGIKNNRALSLAAYSQERLDQEMLTFGIQSRNDLELFQTKTIESLKEEIRQAKDVHTVVFSSEHFQSRLRTEDEIRRLRDILHTLGCLEILVVVYLRNPADLANSLYSTAIETGSTEVQPPNPDNSHWHHIFDHRKTLVQFGVVFGEDSLLPRIYSKTDLIGGSIIDDFVASVRLPFVCDEYQIPPPQNTGMTLLGIEILRRINERIPLLEGGMYLNPLRGDLASFIRAHFSEGPKYVMPEDLQRKYNTEFKDSNEWVRAKYFPDRHCLFQETIIPESVSVPYKSTDLDQIAEALAEIWLEKSQTAVDLENSKLYRWVRRFWKLKARLFPF